MAHATVDLTDASGGINLRLEPDADEAVVLEKLRELLVAYGVRSEGPPQIDTSIPAATLPLTDAKRDVDVQITPVSGGARVEAATSKVRSFRVVQATPAAIAQGLADAWCQVVGRVPIEVVSVGVGDDHLLTATVSNGVMEASGSAKVAAGWEKALAGAMGIALDQIFASSDSAVAVSP